MTTDATLEEIKSGKIFPLYLFFGPEEFLVEKKLNQTINALLDPSAKDFNLNTYYADACLPIEIFDTARSLPFMAKRRVIVVKKVDDAKKSFTDNKILINYLESPIEETCLIFTAKTIDKRKKFYTLISKKGKIVHCPKLKSYQTSKWIIDKAKEQKYQIESSAAKYLAEAFDNHLMRIETELEKIFLFSGETKRIDLNMVQLVAGNPKVDSIFALTGAIGERSVDQSLRKMENLLAHGAQPLQTLGMITRQFRLIWQTKALKDKKVSPSIISGKIGVPPYFIGEIISQAGKFTRENLILAFERLLQADLELKSTARPPGLVMDSLVIDLCLS